MPAITWDKKSQRYRFTDTGTYASATAVRNLLSKAAEQSADRIDKIADRFVSGKINTTTWATQTAAELKTLHSWGYLLGVGGRRGMTQADYGILGSRLKAQYNYLKGFASDIVITGMSEKQFRARLGMYVSAVRGSYERARSESHLREGYLSEQRRRTKTESCQECLWYAMRGWQPLGLLPPPTTACTCRSNCGCYKIYSKKTVLELSRET